MAEGRAVRLSAMDRLILQRKLDNSKNEENKKLLASILIEGKPRADANTHKETEKITPSQLDEEDHPERAIPDIPENKRVRDYLKSQPLNGHGAAFGKAIRVVQCYRCKVGDFVTSHCKCYGHRPGDPECKFTESGDLNLELQRRIREDPMHYFKQFNHEGGENDKIKRMKELLREAKEEKRHKHRHRHKHKHRHQTKGVSHYSSSEE